MVIETERLCRADQLSLLVHDALDRRVNDESRDDDEEQREGNAQAGYALCRKRKMHISAVGTDIKNKPAAVLELVEILFGVVQLLNILVIFFYGVVVFFLFVGEGLFAVLELLDAVFIYLFARDVLCDAVVILAFAAVIFLQTRLILR